MYGVVTMADVLNGVVPVKDGFSFALNLVIQLHTKLNLARQTEVRRIQGTGKSAYNPRWRDPNGTKAYEQTIVFGVDEIRINGHFQHASIFTAIHEELAVAMGIIKAKGDTTPGPSTLVAFQGNDYKKPSSWARFFSLSNSSEKFLEMRASVNWEIRGLNGGWFEKEFVNPNRTLRVYSNANTSSMVGNQVSDVLREVNFDSTKEGQQYFEPKHRQYLQVRQQEYEVMEIALDDLNGVPVKLGPGVTSVVLHFRHRNDGGDGDV